MSEADKAQSPQGIKLDKRALTAIGVIGVGLAFTFLSGPSQQVESVDVAAKPIEIGSDQINEISVKDKDAALTVFAKQFEALEQKLTIQEREAALRDENLRKEVKEVTNTFKAQVAALSGELVSIQAKGVESVYQNANQNDSKTIQTPPPMPDKLPDLGLDGGLNFDGLNILLYVINMLLILKGIYCIVLWTAFHGY